MGTYTMKKAHEPKRPIELFNVLCQMLEGTSYLTPHIVSTHGASEATREGDGPAAGQQCATSPPEAHYITKQ